MREKEFFDYLNKQWGEAEPQGSDSVQVYTQVDRYEENPIGTLHSAVIMTAKMTRAVEHLRAVIYNPQRDIIFVIHEGDYTTLIDPYDGANTEVALELTDKVTILPPARG